MLRLRIGQSLAVDFTKTQGSGHYFALLKHVIETDRAKRNRNRGIENKSDWLTACSFRQKIVHFFRQSARQGDDIMNFANWFVVLLASFVVLTQLTLMHTI
jgi:hypothetical protein